MVIQNSDPDEIILKLYLLSLCLAFLDYFIWQVEQLRQIHIQALHLFLLANCYANI